MRKLVILSAGLSTPSTTGTLATAIGEAVGAAVGGRGESMETTTIEVKNLAVDLAHAMTTGGILSPALEEAVDTMRNADGLVIVTPIFQASFAGLLKMLLDVMDKNDLRGIPTLIAATAGTPRHSLALDYALRPVLTAMHADVVPTTVFAATADFGSSDGAEFTRRIARAAAEIAELMVATAGSVGGLGASASSVRSKTKSPQDNYTPFEDLLNGLGN
ncbi:CE1759 family FMN reductase [Corynebacterium caspium]|uniref:CE1759 family FMN reductase n=1 Tax=Corynebacterium caspium TaxID=234828 RepID=UPI00036FFFC5|nr:CE1759 family FMN reductase [Corynebacterium caspium]WKD59189.1 FMN reductase (NADPH) [Corynebacterium caspium DSM 44850]